MTSAGVKTFTTAGPGALILRPSTSYFVVFSFRDSGVGIFGLGHGDDAETGLSDWAVTDSLLSRFKNTSVTESWTTESGSPAGIRLRGRSLGDAPEVVGLRITSNPSANDSYATGNVIEVTATFIDEVTVDTTSGTPRLALTVGSSTRYADYSASDSTATALVFAYPVTANDRDEDGISIVTDALELNGGAIHKKGDTSTDAVLDHGALSAQSGHRVNRAPFIVSGGVAVTSSPDANGSYATGDVIEVTATFSEAVTVDTMSGTPRLELTVGSNTPYTPTTRRATAPPPHWCSPTR